MDTAPNPFKTHTIGAPKNTPDCHPLEVTVGVSKGLCVMVSAWKPTDAEIDALKRGEKLWLYIYGNAHPMVGMSVGERPEL